MKEEKLKINGIDTTLYKTDKYTTLHIELYFTLDYNTQDFYLLELLGDYMLATNKKYKTKEELLDLKYEMYSFDSYVNIVRYGKNIVFNLSFEIISPKLVKDEYFQRLLKEVHTLIFDANFTNALPDEKVFEKCKNGLIGNYESTNSDIHYIANTRFMKNAYPDTIVDKALLSASEYKDLINSFSGKEMHDLYKKLIGEKISEIILFGDFKDEYIKVLEKNLTFKNHNKKPLKYEFIKACPKSASITEKIDNVETNIFVLYTFEGLTRKEKLTLVTLSGILNFGGRLLHKLFREKLALVYSSYAEIKINAETLSIVGNINSKNKDKFLEGVDYLFNEVLNDKRIVEEAIENYLKHTRVSFITRDENKWTVLRDLTGKKLYDNFTIEEVYNHAKEVKHSDILSLIKKAKKTLCYTLEGEKNDERI